MASFLTTGSGDTQVSHSGAADGRRNSTRPSSFEQWEQWGQIDRREGPSGDKKAKLNWLYGIPDNRRYGISGKHPKLEPEVRLRLLYQTTGVYSTDIAKYNTAQGFLYACKKGAKASPASLTHPEIVFNTQGTKQLNSIHVHLVDKVTGEVYWDADYRLGRKPFFRKKGIGKKTRSLNRKDVFEPICLEPDDPGPHLFDLSVRSTSGTYWDGKTPLGEMEGFGKADGIREHIGFEAYRLPVLEEGVDGLQKEVLGDWVKDGSFSRGPVLTTQAQRLLAKQEDPWKSQSSTGRLYYDYIIANKPRKKNKYEYLEKMALPPINDLVRTAKFKELSLPLIFPKDR